MTLRPDIDKTRQAIARLVGSLTSDPSEQASIIQTASQEAIELLWRERPDEN
jgi:hypothetical protein